VSGGLVLSCALSQPNAPWAKINWLDFIYESGEQAEIGK